jgi:hypothetical protein
MNKKSKDELAKDWQALLSKHSKPLEKGAKAKGVKVSNIRNVSVQKNVIELEKIRSLVTPGGNTALKAPKVYTGTEVLGVAVLHKSCLQPIFNKEAAVETAQMRRN